MLVRSEVLVAPDGEHGAYTESLATGGIKLAENAPGGLLEPECANITKIFITDRRGGEFRLGLTISPTESALGNAARLVDWSPDSRYLLLESARFQWGSDVGSSDPVLYDARSETFSDPGLACRAFKKWAKRDCAVGSVIPLGFSPEGKVVLKAGPSYPATSENKDLEPNSCLQKSGTWVYDPATGNLSECLNNYQVRPFAKFRAR
jgi:hypothetical protein